MRVLLFIHTAAVLHTFDLRIFSSFERNTRKSKNTYTHTHSYRILSTASKTDIFLVFWLWYGSSWLQHWHQAILCLYNAFYSHFILLPVLLPYSLLLILDLDYICFFIRRRYSYVNSVEFLMGFCVISTFDGHYHCSDMKRLPFD